MIMSNEHMFGTKHLLPNISSPADSSWKIFYIGPDSYIWISAYGYKLLTNVLILSFNLMSVLSQASGFFSFPLSSQRGLSSLPLRMRLLRGSESLQEDTYEEGQKFSDREFVKILVGGGIPQAPPQYIDRGNPGHQPTTKD